MKVLMLSWEFPPHNVGGLGKHVTELIPALANEQVEVHLLTPRWGGGSGEEVFEQVIDQDAVAMEEAGSVRRLVRTAIHRVEPPSVGRDDFFTESWRTNLSLEERGRLLLQQAKDDHPFDLIHCHDWLSAFAGVALKHAFKLPLIATVHATEYGRSRGNLQSEMQKSIHSVDWWLTFEAWRIICASQFMADEIKYAFQVPEDKIDVIPNGVDTHRFDALDGVDLSGFRLRFAEPDQPMIFYVGRVVFEKGVHVLVECLPRVLEWYPRARLVIAGTGNHLGTVRSRVTELGLGDSVILTGFLSDEDRDQLFKVADVGVFPSLYEPFGIVALEAMAARLPVIVADVGGLREVVTPHETGLTSIPDHRDSLAWAILHALDHPEWTRTRADNAYRVVRSQFNWQAIARSTKRVYERVVSERARATW